MTSAPIRASRSLLMATASALSALVQAQPVSPSQPLPATPPSAPWTPTTLPEPEQALPAVTVTGTREQALLANTPASISVISARTVRETAPSHPQQLLGQVPGVAIGVTNGEGHTTAIRQPFTTAPLYLYLEDGLPIRATGFFNHNALYEVNLPMAGGVEVVRGPGTALYGSDAIGGIVNVLTRIPAPQPGLAIYAEAGGHGWRRAMIEADTGAGVAGALRGELNVTHTDGWRDRTAYDKQSGQLRWDTSLGAAGSLKTVITFSRIDQETGANSPLPYADYRDNPTRNTLSIAFRKVGALRLSSAWDSSVAGGLLSITPYLRDNSMDLLASFNLNADPNVTYTTNRSFGLTAKWRRDFPSLMRARLIAGLDLESSPGTHIENRLDVTATGSGASRQFSAYTIGTRIFDYEVAFKAASPYLHAEFSPATRLRVTAGLRYDHLSYGVTNRLGPAPVKDVSSSNWYGQSADSRRSFECLSPKVGATWEIDANHHGYASYNTGFRAPSESQLFRPAVATNPTDATRRALLALELKPVKAEQLEIGLRGQTAGLHYNVVAFELLKRDDLLSQRDLATNLSTTVNAGKTQHRGVEIGLGTRIDQTWRLDAALSYMRHRYLDWFTASADYSGKAMEAAPRTLGNLRLTWSPKPRALAQLEWVHLGSYWLEASNAATYPRYGGHNLIHLRLAWPLEPRVGLFARVYNLADRRHADSASVSFNTPVYSPGLPRTAYAGVEVRW